jgi:hypothetical protein
VVGADNLGKCRPVGFRAYVGVRGPNQLVAGDTMAGGGHAAQTKVGGVSQDSGEQGVFVVATLAGAQVGEGGRKTRHAIHLVQQLRDARRRHHGFNPVCKGAGFRRGSRLDWCDVQAAVA